ncbi:chitin-binding protein, partial [Streptomyces rimosus subsp. rimosus]
MGRKLPSLPLGLGLAGTALLATSGSAQGPGYTAWPVSRQ